MTEDEAQRWVIDRFGADRHARLQRYVDILVAETERQNLIAASTVPSVWSRHIVDSAQLLDLAGQSWSHWVDIGAGAGLPGIVISVLSDQQVTLIEPRKLRAAFLSDCATNLSVDVKVVQAKAERVDHIDTADVVSARAVTNLASLLAAARGFATRHTRFVLPKGAVAQSEVAAARKSWQGTFHVEQSIVDPESGIVVATGVAPR